MRVIITGATGFIGSHLVRVFLDRGDEVWALVRQGSPRLGVLPQEAGLSLVYGDLEHVEEAVSRIGGGDVFLHMAWGRREPGGNRLPGGSAEKCGGPP